MDLVTIEKNISTYENTLGQDTEWAELAKIMNFSNLLFGKALEVGIQKGLAEGLIESEIIEKLLDAGCKLSTKQLYKKIKFHSFKIDLSLSRTVPLNIPKTSRQFNQLDGISATDKAQFFTDVQGNSNIQPSSDRIKKVKDTLNSVVQDKKKDDTPKGTPTYLSPDQMISFNEWFESKHGKTHTSMKPSIDLDKAVNVKDDVINDLASHASEWSKVRKSILAFAHTDNGGNKDAFVFIKRLDKLMESFVDLLKYSEYRHFIRQEKNEWWRDIRND